MTSPYTDIQRYFRAFAPAQRRELEIFFNDTFPTLDLDIAFNPTGNLTGDVLADDGTAIVSSGADQANSVVTAGSIVGALTGNATTATTATKVVLTDNESTNEENAIVFGADGDVDGSTSIGLESDGNLTYNPSLGRLTATVLKGKPNLTSGTPVNAVAASGVFTPSDVASDDEEITIGTDVYQIVGDGSGVTASQFLVDTSATALQATGTWTASGTFSDDETITINGRVYEIVGDGSGLSAGDVLVDTSATAEAAVNTLTISGVVIDGETVTIGSQVYEFDTDSSVSGGNTAVDISAAAVASQGTLTLSGVAIDAETVTIGGRVYELDARDSEHISGDVRVNINEGTGYTTKSQATITFANGDIHDDTVVIQGNTHTLKTDGTVDSASVCDITGAATLAAAEFTVTFGAVPLDAEGVTINGRVYEFDTGDDGIVGDVEVDTSASVTGTDAATAFQTAVNGDGSAEYSCARDGYVCTLTAKIAGVAANSHVLSEDMTDCFLSGTNPTGGADATGAEIATIFLTHLQNAGAETDITPSAGGSGEVVLTWDVGGTAGDATTLTETLTAGSCDGGGTFGGTTAGADCTAPNAVTAIVAAIEGDGSATWGAADGAGDTVVVTADTPGTAGDSITFAEAMANGAVDAATLGTTTAGVDCPAADAVTALVSAITTSDTQGVGAVDGAGDTVDLTADTKGSAGNSIGTTETMANGSFDDVTLTGGIAASQAGACAALAVAVNGDGSATWGATDNLDNTVTITADAKGSAGNSITTVDGTANGAFGAGTLSGGHAGTIAGVCAALTASITTNDTMGVGATDHGSTHVDLLADTKGVAGNSIATTETCGNAAFGAATLEGGTDGTVGNQYDVLVDTSYLYVAIGNNTIADANWRRIDLGSAY